MENPTTCNSSINWNEVKESDLTAKQLFRNQVTNFFDVNIFLTRFTSTEVDALFIHCLHSDDYLLSVFSDQQIEDICLNTFNEQKELNDNLNLRCKLMKQKEMK